MNTLEAAIPPLPWIFLLILALMVIIGITLVMTTETQNEGTQGDLISFQSNTYLQTSLPITISSRVYGVSMHNEIDCLIKYESGGREDVYGDNGKAYGILQFHRPTFELYSTKYELDIDYKNPEHQIILAEKMLKDGLAYHWTPWRKCF